MNTREIAKEYRLGHWAQVLQQRTQSRLSIKAYCEREGIHENTYFYWQRKLRETACTEITKTEEPRNIVPSGWMQLEPKQVQHANEALIIEINGCHVTLNAETDPELLKKVCRILRSL